MHDVLICCSVKKADPSDIVVSEDRQAGENNGALSETQQPKE